MNRKSQKAALEMFREAAYTAEDEAVREASEHRDHLKLLVLIDAGAARPAELAMASRPRTHRQWAQTAFGIKAQARREAERHPNLADLSRRMVKHNPIGAARVARAMIQAEAERHDALSIAIATFADAFGC